MTPPDPTDVVNLAVIAGVVVFALRRPRARRAIGPGAPVYDSRAAVDPADVATIYRRRS